MFLGGSVDGVLLLGAATAGVCMEWLLDRISYMRLSCSVEFEFNRACQLQNNLTFEKKSSEKCVSEE